MPSGRTRSRPEAPPIFFLDRGLGRNIVAAALRDAGFVVVTMIDVYPNGTDQRVGDDEWIARASHEGWVALTKDASIIRDHVAALAASTLRVFALNNANVSGPEMARRYVINLSRMVHRARQPGPYVYVVSPSGLELRWRPEFVR
jgi:hypothetical protein